eukprot:1258397-Prymnesium_polylepis.1
MVAAAAMGRMVQWRMRPRRPCPQAGTTSLELGHDGIVLCVGNGTSCDRLLAHGEGRGGHAGSVHQLAQKSPQCDRRERPRGGA